MLAELVRRMLDVDPSRHSQKAMAMKGFVGFFLSEKGSVGEVGLATRFSSSNGVTNGSTTWEECRACVVVSNRVTGVGVSGSSVSDR